MIVNNKKIKSFVSNFLLKLYTFVIGKEPCIVYRRSYSYTSNKIGFSNNCPFCKLEKESILYSGKYRNVIKNKYPYPKTSKHLLVIPKRHIRIWGDIKYDELFELKEILNDYLEKGFLLLGRHFGSHKDASVEHLHIHLIK